MPDLDYLDGLCLLIIEFWFPIVVQAQHINLLHLHPIHRLQLLYFFLHVLHLTLNRVWSP
jgi:hypothetical protein